MKKRIEGEDIREQVTRILWEERIMRGMSTYEMAALLETTQPHYWNWENGRKKPDSIRKIDWMLKKLGRTITVGAVEGKENEHGC